MESNVPSLRDVNLKLKGHNDCNGSKNDKLYEGPIFEDGGRPIPFFPQENLTVRPRTHIKVKFFTKSGNGDTPKFLFPALLHELPQQGQLFKIEDTLYEVRTITRNMSFVGRFNDIAKEFEPDILLAPHIPRTEKPYVRQHRSYTTPRQY